MIIWLIGMSGSGKSTIGGEVYSFRKETNQSTVFLDGDNVRDMLKNDADHTIQGRYKNAERISNICKFLDNEGIDVVAAVLSIFPEWQDWNRDNFKEYYEIFLDVPIEELKRRDPKGLYEKAFNGNLKNFVGFDLEFPRPTKSNLVVNESIMATGVDATVKYILDRLK